MDTGTEFENPSAVVTVAVTFARVPPFSVGAGHVRPFGQRPPSGDATHWNTLTSEAVPPMVSSARIRRSPFLWTPSNGLPPPPPRGPKPTAFWKNQAPIKALPSLDSRSPPI